MTNIRIVQICESSKQRVRIKTEIVEFGGEFPYLERWVINPQRFVTCSVPFLGAKI